METWNEQLIHAEIHEDEMNNFINEDMNNFDNEFLVQIWRTFNFGPKVAESLNSLIECSSTLKCSSNFGLKLKNIQIFSSLKSWRTKLKNIPNWMFFNFFKVLQHLTKSWRALNVLQFLKYSSNLGQMFFNFGFKKFYGTFLSHSPNFGPVQSNHFNMSHLLNFTQQKIFFHACRFVTKILDFRFSFVTKILDFLSSQRF